MKKKIAELKRLADMIYDIELAKLQDVSSDINSIREQDSSAKEAVRVRQAQVSEGCADDLAFSLGRDGPWEQWHAQQRRARNMELARKMAAREERLVDARLAMGRSEVLGRLLLDDEKQR